MSNAFARSLRAELILGAIVAAFMALLAVASSAEASAGCANEQFRTGPSASLPDCRAYEQVSPQDKNGGNVDGGLQLESEPAPEQAASNGESVTYASQTPFTSVGAQSAVASSQYLSRRTAEGWLTTAIDPSQEYPDGRLSLFGSISESLYQGFNENLQYGFLASENPPIVPEAPEGHYNPYIRNTTSGSYTLLAPLGPSVKTPETPVYGRGLFVEYAGMSEDGSHVIFVSNAALTPEAAPENTNLYEWNSGRLELVNVYPDGEPDSGGSADVASSGLRFGGRVEQGEQGVYFNMAHALSANGLRAFWTGSEGRLYMHELTGSGARTVEISASQKAGALAETGEYAHYWTASEDGSLVYFSSCEQLTDDSTAVEGSCFGSEIYAIASTGQDLYQYNVETGKLTDVTVDPHAGHTADVQGVLGASSDGSYVYFAAEGVLAEGAVEGAYNIYLWHDGTTSFVTTLRHAPEALAWDRGTRERTSRVSENGQFLAFESALALTTPGTTTPSSPGSCKDHESQTFEGETQYSERATFSRLTEDGKRCLQVYEYDASTGELVCASCEPNGFPPTGSSVVPGTANTLQPDTGWESTTKQQRYLLNDGRLFFNSTAALLPQDTNETEDVYEYEPSGVGSCVGGKACLALISSGTSPSRSQFIAADSEGNNVFFTTFEKLTASDGDEAADLYDARVAGGFAEASALPCSGEACKPAIGAAPSIYGAPASQTFNGAGNPFDEALVGKSGGSAGTGKSTARKPKERRASGRCRKKKAKRRARCERQVSKRIAVSKQSDRAHSKDGNRRSK